MATTCSDFSTPAVVALLTTAFLASSVAPTFADDKALCSPIRNGNDRATCETLVAPPPGGNRWIYEPYFDPIEASVTHVIRLDGEAAYDAAILRIGCTLESRGVSLEFPGQAFVVNRPMTIRIDEAPPGKAQFEDTEGSKAAIAQPEDLIRGLFGAHHLAVSVFLERGNGIARFPVDGLEDSFRTLTDACGWHLP